MAMSKIRLLQSSRKSITIIVLLCLIVVQGTQSAKRMQYNNLFTSGNHNARLAENNLQESRRLFLSRMQPAEKFERLVFQRQFIDGIQQESGNQIQRLRRSVTTTASEGKTTMNFVYTAWGEWSECDATDCATEGSQWKTRKCAGNNFQVGTNHPCKYENLVRVRQCYPRECDSKNITQWSEWGKWSTCSITCGRGGVQTRSRVCFTDNEENTASSKCTGESVAERSCRYSSSCPLWDKWTSWGACSHSCGQIGVSYRKINCIVYRYIALKEATDSKEIRDQTDDTIEEEFVPKFTENLTKDDLKYEEELVKILHGGREVYIVDVPNRLNGRVLILYEKPMKEIVPHEKCPSLNRRVEERKSCSVQQICPSMWSTWGAWTECDPNCAAGLSRRKRRCNLNSKKTPCRGLRFRLRRCYSPPCWSTWTNIGTCSSTCGHGLQKRERKCLSSSSIPLYNKCRGRSDSIEPCKLKSCTDNEWSAWSKFSQCTVSCNRGIQFRNRTCLIGNCIGSSNDVRLCSKQRCPTWSRWGPYTCCSRTCGKGIKTRTRVCVHGSTKDRGCHIGSTIQTHPCFRPSCENFGEKIELFENLACGKKSRSSLKTIIHLKIFGGKEAAPNGWPWQASWQHRTGVGRPWKHLCGGSLIHPRWILSAAHCIENAEYSVLHTDPGIWWSIVLGMHKLHKDGTRFFVREIFVHEDYSLGRVALNDIALLKLRKMVPITKTVSPVCLPGLKRPTTGESCIISGWGFTGPERKKPDVLQDATVPIVEFEKCKSVGDYYKDHLSKYHLCAGNPVNMTTDSCVGDSGGPLSCKNNDTWYVAAVTSFAFSDCGTSGHLGIYAPVYEFETWIRNITEANTFEQC